MLGAHSLWRGLYSALQMGFANQRARQSAQLAVKNDARGRARKFSASERERSSSVASSV